MARSLITRVNVACFVGLVFAMAVVAQDRSQLALLVALALVAGGQLVWLWRGNALGIAEILLYAVVFRLVLFLLPPSLSDDAYRYVWDGRVQSIGVNPYHYAPEDTSLAALHDEPIYARLNSLSYFSVYPPVSQGVFAVGALFYDRGWIYSHYAVKLVLMLMELLAVFLLARMVDKKWLLLYAWNPLVLLETAGQAHTESALLLLLVLVVLLVKARRAAWASAALAVAGWVKLFPFVLFPFLWRRFKWRGIWPGALVTVVLAIPYAAPYVLANVSTSLDLYARLFEFNAGLYYSIKQAFLLVTGADWSKQIGPALRLLFVVGLPVIYILDWRRRWSIARAFLVAIGLYLVLATTVHPWYLLSVLLLAALLQTAAWHWYWLGLFSIGTYLLYAGGPYWEFVAIGWGGWFLLVAWRYGPSMLQTILRLRARSKYRFIRPYLPRLHRPLAVMDLGAGEGYLGAFIHRARGANVVLVDVVDMNKSDLELVTFEGRELPWPDDTFDAVILYFVLHHADDQRKLLREALRVTTDRVIVVESVFDSYADRRILTTLDKAANRIRFGGRMNVQESHLHFRTIGAWRAVFARECAEILTVQRRGYRLHKQALFVLAKGIGPRKPSQY